METFAPKGNIYGPILPQFVLQMSITFGAKTMYAILCDYAADKDHCWPSQATLANSMGTAENGGTYVYRIRNELNSRTSAGNYQYLGTWEASFSDSLIYSIDKNKPVICHVKTGILPNYNYASNTGHYIVSTGYYVAYSGSSATATCRYNDPHNNNSFYGTYNCDISTMTTAINNNAGYYISGT